LIKVDNAIGISEYRIVVINACDPAISYDTAAMYQCTQISRDIKL